MNKIVVIGDSHSQLFSNNEQFKRGMWSDINLEKYFDVRWLGPVTFWRLCRDQKNFIDFNEDIFYTPFPSMTVTTKIDPSIDIMISLGEIDVRCHLSNQKNKKTIDDMSLLIEKFLINYQNHKIHLLSIIPPIRKNDCISHNDMFPFIGEDEERANNTKYFNEKLKKISNDYNIRYFDLYSLYVDDENFLDISKSDKIVHAIKTERLEKYIKSYFKL